MEAPENKTQTSEIIYGIQPVTEAIQNGIEINKVLVQKDLKNASVNHIIQMCKQAGIPYQTAPKEKFFFLKQKNHQGVYAQVSPVIYHNLETLTRQWFEEGLDPLIVVLDKITDMRNFGAIARTAYCSGVHAIVVPFTDNAPVNNDAIKTSAGALLKIPVCREKHLKTTIEYLNQCGFATIACTEKAEYTLSQTDFTGPVAIVLGNEEKGISMEVLKRCTHRARIPMDFGVASLNVSVAAGIALYEAICQRN